MLCNRIKSDLIGEVMHKRLVGKKRQYNCALAVLDSLQNGCSFLCVQHFREEDHRILKNRLSFQFDHISLLHGYKFHQQTRHPLDNLPQAKEVIHRQGAFCGLSKMEVLLEQVGYFDLVLVVSKGVELGHFSFDKSALFDLFKHIARDMDVR